MKNNTYLLIFGVIWWLLIILAAANQPVKREEKSKEKTLSTPVEKWDNESNPRKKQWLETLYKQWSN